MRGRRTIPQAKPCACYLKDGYLQACSLHAAAREMLRALEALVMIPVPDGSIGKARAAIAKAKEEVKK